MPPENIYQYHATERMKNAMPSMRYRFTRSASKSFIEADLFSLLKRKHGLARLIKICRLHQQLTDKRGIFYLSIDITGGDEEKCFKNKLMKNRDAKMLSI